MKVEGEMGVNRKLTRVIFVVYAPSADCVRGVVLQSGRHTHTHTHTHADNRIELLPLLSCDQVCGHR